MKNDSEDWREVPQLRSLRRLVSVLTIVLIFGMVAVAGALVWRISSEPGAAAPLVTADEITLPAGEIVTSVGATEAALSLFTRDAEGVERLRVFDPATGDETGVLTIGRGE